MTIDTKALDPDVQELDRVTIRFTGDSGDGMQLTGTQFTRTAAVYGNDISDAARTTPRRSAPRPARCRASRASRSASARARSTRPGDQPDVLVAMNPAALKTNVGDLPAGGALIVNSDAFTPANLSKAGYASNPLTDGSLKQYALFEIPISTLNERSLEGLEHDQQAEGPDQELLRPRDHVLALRPGNRGDDPLDRRQVRQAARHRRGEQAGAQGRLRVRRDDRDLPHPLPGRAGPSRAGHVPQHHRQRGDRARACWPPRSWPGGRSSTARTRSRRPRDILHQLSGYKNFGVKTFQAEDEIAAIGAAIGASYGGAMGLTASSGPGHRAQVARRSAWRS